mmetsp:Transcript_40777/g.89121  ORF Transcript_40777/g.89121 Transcript_40777/m.89121 type:complete len:204 (+) Transcript_40777:33-644(+)
MCTVVSGNHRRNRRLLDLSAEASRRDAIVDELHHKVVHELIRKHCFSCKGGRLSRACVTVLLTDLNLSSGTPPTDDEVEYIFSQSRGTHPDGSLSLHHLPHAIGLWQSFCKQRFDLERALTHFSRSGKMDRLAFKRYLQLLNCGKPVPDDVVDKIMQADGLQGRPQNVISSAAQLAFALTAWYELSGVLASSPSSAKGSCVLQ